jgi:uncharacterized protein (TIGR02145 family)
MKRLFLFIAFIFANISIQAQIVSTFAGTGAIGSNNSPNATFKSPTATCVDAAGNVYVADQLNHLIRKITPAGVVSTVAGTAGVAGYVDAAGAAAKFNEPVGIAFDAQNNLLYVSEYRNHTVRKIDINGVVSTLAGTGAIGAVDATGMAASFWNPGNLCVDDLGNVYLADRSNMKIRKITPAGVVTTFAGTGTAGSVNGTRLAATFNYPSDITFDKASGNFYVSDEYSHQIRKISPAGMVSTVAGSGAVGNADGAANVATFDRPSGIYVDANCNLYVTQYNGHTVRKIDPNGNVSTYAGSAASGFVNGIGTAAKFYFAFSVDGDTQGNLYIADNGNNAIRKIANSNNTWRYVDSEAGFNVGIKSDGTLWAWGNNNGFQLGDGTTQDKDRPVKIDNGNNWSQISVGLDHTLALKSDGSLWAWGYNSYGQLGDNTILNKCRPTRIGTDFDWVKIDAGGLSSHAIKQNGTLWAWGYNGSGVLGDGTQTERHFPKQIGTNTDWAAVSTSFGHTLALKSDGSLWAWGYNLYGQLGDATSTDKYSPISIGISQWNDISAGPEFSIAIKNDGTLWAWGANYENQVGDNTLTRRNIPTLINASNNWLSVSAGINGSAAMHNEGLPLKSIWVWGNNNNGQLGNGTTAPIAVPTKIGSLNTWTKSRLGSIHQVIIANNGDLYSCGGYGVGQLGNGNPLNNNANVLSPTLIVPLTYNANRVYVNYSATGTQNGTSWPNAFTSIDDALSAARNNYITEIWVAKGIYKPNKYPNDVACDVIFTNRDKTFHLVDGVKMYGGFTGTETDINQRVNILTNETILSGDLLGNDMPGSVGQSLANKTDNVYHVVVSVNDNNCTLLDGFTVKGGQANGGPTYTVEGKTFYPLIGGGAFTLFSDMQFNKVNFEENYADYAGGIMNAGGSPTIENSAFYLNKCSVGGGGAIISNEGNPIITNSVFSDNTSPNGGPSILNAGYAGIISTIYLTNSTFYNSISTNYTIFGAIDNGNSTGRVVSKNNIFWNGGLGIKDNGLTSIVQNTILSNPLFLGNSGNFNADPLFKNPANPKGTDGVWRTPDDGLILQDCSPAINGGDNASVANFLVDMKNETRTKTCVVDMGAYESYGNPCSLVQTIASGNWTNGAIWNIGRPPIETENAIISALNTVTVNSVVNVNNIQLITGASINNQGNIVLGGVNNTACPLQICGQVWMAKNLDVDTYRDGTPIPQVTSPAAWAGLTTGAWCSYNNDPILGATYGKLYNWYAVNDPRGLAPAGWHIPSDVEMSQLINCLGGNSTPGIMQIFSQVSLKLKEQGTLNWGMSNLASTNSSGFTALPSGIRTSGGSFQNLNAQTLFWSATPFNNNAWDILLYNYDNLSFGAALKGNGCSVRCVKD